MADQIERELLLPAPPEELWEVVTSPGWLALDVQFELTPGGEASFESEDFSKRGWVEEATPPGTADETGGRLVFWWAEDDQPATRVELTLVPEGQHSTRLRVVEARPLEVLDLVGMPLPGQVDGTRGPAMLVAA